VVYDEWLYNRKANGRPGIADRTSHNLSGFLVGAVFHTPDRKLIFANPVQYQFHCDEY
jgi:hypothetical protein